MTIPKTAARFNARVTNRVSRRFAGRLAGFAVVTHVGRRSGRTYQPRIFTDPDRRLAPGPVRVALELLDGSDYLSMRPAPAQF